MIEKQNAPQTLTPVEAVARIALSGKCVAGYPRHHSIINEAFIQAAEALAKRDETSYEDSITRTLHAVLDCATAMSFYAENNRVLHAGLDLVSLYDERLPEDNEALMRAEKTWKKEKKDGFHGSAFQAFLKKEMKNPETSVSKEMKEALGYKPGFSRLSFD